MTFTPAAAVLYMPKLTSTSSNTRDYADYTLGLQSEIANDFTSFKIDFQPTYQIAELWSEKSLLNGLDGKSYTLTPSKNSMEFTGTFKVTATSVWDITIKQVRCLV